MIARRHLAVTNNYPQIYSAGNRNFFSDKPNFICSSSIICNVYFYVNSKHSLGNEISGGFLTSDEQISLHRGIFAATCLPIRQHQCPLKILLNVHFIIQFHGHGIAR